MVLHYAGIVAAAWLAAPHARAPAGGRPAAPARAAAPRLCAAGSYEIPLFDPKGDELPFPFPAPLPRGDEGFGEAPPYRYAFDRPVYVRMLRDATEHAADDAPAYVGHCVVPGDGELVGALSLGPDTIVRVGTVGAAIRVGSVEIDASPAGGGSAPGIGDEVATISGTGAFRFVVERERL